MTDPGPPPPAPPARSATPYTTLRRLLTVAPVTLGLALFALAVAGALPGLWTLRRTGLRIEGAGVVELESGPEEASSRPAPALALPPGTAVAPRPGAVATAAQIWKSTCSSCHGPTGVPTSLGRQVGAADLSAPAVQAKSDAELRATILDGRGRMLPYRGRLSEAQVDDLVRHLRSFRGSRAN